MSVYHLNILSTIVLKSDFQHNFIWNFSWITLLIVYTNLEKKKGCEQTTCILRKLKSYCHISFAEVKKIK